MSSSNFKKSIKYLICGMILGGCLCGRVLGQELSARGFSVYGKGLVYFEAGQFQRAATDWITIGEQFLDRPDKSSLRMAALANILATIAFEKDNNARAYLTWGNAIRFFLEGNTSWEEEKKRIRLMNRKIRRQLAAGQTNISLLTGSDDEVTALRLQSRLSLADYNGPASGLAVQSSRQKSPQIHVRRDYFAKPQAIIPKKLDGKTPESNAGLIAANTQSRSFSRQSALPVMGRGIRLQPVPDQGSKSDLNLKAGNVSHKINRLRTGMIFHAQPKDEKQLESSELKTGRTGDSNTATVFKLSSVAASKRMAFSHEEQKIAQTAWRYFSANYQANTGLVNSVHNYPYTTLWDMGSNLAGFVAAVKLNIIDNQEFKEKTIRFLETLLFIELYNQELPNREYHTRTGEMTDLTNRISHKGSGWSALDIGRLLIWLKITMAWFPDLKDLILSVVERWQFDRVCLYKVLNGVLFDGQQEVLRQEGRLGYEQYSGSGYHLWGKDVSGAFDYNSLETVRVSGVELPYDTRNLPFLTSSPLVLGKIELSGIDNRFNKLVTDVYEVQKRRWQKTSVLTAVDEGAIDRRPWFVYNCVTYGPMPWVCTDSKGNPAPGLKNLSTKAALAWSVIMDDPYSKKLRDAVMDLNHPRLGFKSGLFENQETNTSMDINTNAVILESMLYLKRERHSFLPMISGD